MRRTAAFGAAVMAVTFDAGVACSAKPVTDVVRRGPAACPSGFAADDTHASRVERLADESRAESSVVVCFGPRGTRAAVTGSTVLLDEAASDGELAVELAHLLVHVEDGLGDGCARGRAVARASEERARRVETRVRARLHVSPAPLAFGDAEADYASRCDR